MSKELPHASIRCSECGTKLKVTLKKGRVPSKPIPCPKCKNPIPVTEDDVVHPGTKKGSKRAAAELRQTKVSQLHRTRDGKVTPAALEALTSMAAQDPPTRDVPTAENESVGAEDPPTRDVPTAENESAADVDDPPTRDVPVEENPAFGVLSKAGERRSAPRKPERDGSFKPDSPGVHVVKGEGPGARDEVFARKRSATPKGSVAIGRIKLSSSLGSGPKSEVEEDDPDLPMLRSESEVGDDEQTSKPPKKKLRLKKALAKLKKKKSGPAEEAEGKPDSLGFGLELDSDAFEDAISKASSVAELEPPDSEDLVDEPRPTEPPVSDEELADVSADEIAIEDVPMADVSVDDISEAFDDEQALLDEPEESEPEEAEESEPEEAEESEPDIAEESEPEEAEESEPDIAEESEPEEAEESEPEEAEAESLEEESWVSDGLEEISSSAGRIPDQRSGPPMVGILVGIVFVALIVAAAFVVLVGS